METKHPGSDSRRAPLPEREPAHFRPAWWARSRHLQTVWSRLLRRRVDVPTTRARWTTPDGDFVDIDFADGPIASPQLLAIHGLEGSSQRKYVRGLLALAAGRGWRGVALNFRGCSGTPNRTARLYHSGDSDELDWVVAELVKRDPGAPILPVGVSLGGNVLLKWLGEKEERVPEEVRAAVAISTPFDLAVAAHKMSRGGGRIYTRFFFRTLKPKARQKAREYPDRLDARAIRKARNWRQYDDAVTAPLHGFRDAEDYWARSSSKSFLGRIRRPVLLINALDDPFIPASSLPADVVATSQWLEASFTTNGGHAGFVAGAFPWRPFYWAEHQAVEFLAGYAATMRPVGPDS